jgi:hypothetical protein
MPTARELKLQKLIKDRQQKSESPETQTPESEVIEKEVALETQRDKTEAVETEAVETEVVETESGESTYFQAIGTLSGIPSQDENGRFFIAIGQNRYRLFIPPNRYKGWLKQIANFPDTLLFLRVYPKCFIAPRREPEIHFQVLYWATENKWEEAPGMFIIKGLWQFLPQVRGPVLSIYRNWGSSDPTDKFKAIHLPVIMRREGEVQPFKFNPKIPKEKLPKRWFIQGKFRFMSNRSCFGWVEDLAEPSDRVPRYKKPVKPQATPNQATPNKKEANSTKVTQN